MQASKFSLFTVLSSTFLYQTCDTEFLKCYILVQTEISTVKEEIFVL